MATPYRTIHLEAVRSTQDEASAAFRSSGRDTPVLVVADQQESGRGRSGRRWLEADRGLYSSLALVPPWEVDRWGLLPLVAGLAARRAVADVCDVHIGLKWPNDLELPSGKVGGILVEAAGDVVVVGCGVNLWWRHPSSGASSLLTEDPGPGMSAMLAEHWAADLLNRLEHHPNHWGHDEYRTASVTIGEEVSWDPRGRGTVADVDLDGALVVETAGGRQYLRSGEVRHLRAATLPDADDAS